MTLGTHSATETDTDDTGRGTVTGTVTGTATLGQGRRALVVVAHELEPIREAALRVAREAGYLAVGLTEGESVRALLAWRPVPPDALLVDVGLPKVLGYELCDEIHSRGLPTKVVLIASVYSKTAYKRRPSTLYGADDYIEQHHIPNQLAAKLARILPAPVTAPAPQPQPQPSPPPPPPEDGRPTATCSDGASAPMASPSARHAEVEQIKGASERQTERQFEELCVDGESASERAARLARLIVADVLLYNGAAVDASSSAAELEALLGDDLRAGRELFQSWVPRSIAAQEDFVGAALAAFCSQRRKGGRQ
ncbi:MAG: response regulator [Pseudomonadota bacterium]